MKDRRVSDVQHQKSPETLRALKLGIHFHSTERTHGLCKKTPSMIGTLRRVQPNHLTGRNTVAASNIVAASRGFLSAFRMSSFPWSRFGNEKPFTAGACLLSRPVKAKVGTRVKIRHNSSQPEANLQSQIYTTALQPFLCPYICKHGSLQPYIILYLSKRLMSMSLMFPEQQTALHSSLQLSATRGFCWAALLPWRSWDLRTHPPHGGRTS